MTGCRRFNCRYFLHVTGVAPNIIRFPSMLATFFHFHFSLAALHVPVIDTPEQMPSRFTPAATASTLMPITYMPSQPSAEIFYCAVLRPFIAEAATGQVMPTKIGRLPHARRLLRPPRCLAVKDFSISFALPPTAPLAKLLFCLHATDAFRLASKLLDIVYRSSLPSSARCRAASAASFCFEPRLPTMAPRYATPPSRRLIYFLPRADFR